MNLSERSNIVKIRKNPWWGVKKHNKPEAVKCPVCRRVMHTTPAGEYWCSRRFCIGYCWARQTLDVMRTRLISKYGTKKMRQAARLLLCREDEELKW